MSGFFKNLRSSLSFRLTLNYGLLSILTTLILIAFIHAQVTQTLRSDHARQITATAQRLTAVFAEHGRAGVITAIELTLSDRLDADREIYLLIDEAQQKLAGNLDEPPPVEINPSQPFGAVPHHQKTDLVTVPIRYNGVSREAYLTIQPLADGATLIVGRDASAIAELTALIGQATAAALFLAVCLVLLGASAFRRTLDYRVAQIRRTAQQIRAGQLSLRIPPTPASGEDEFTLLGRDINAMLDRIEWLMKSARHLSDTIAHNLRTPLTRIMGALQTAQRPGVPASAVRSANQDAIDGIARLNVLLEKLLQIADMEAGIQRRAFKPCQINHIAADVIEMYEAWAEEQGIRLRRAQFANVTVSGDANLLASALANLLDNAIKYAASEVVIAVYGLGTKSYVVMSDDGPGLPASEYANLGKHFYRLDTRSAGHGLGLTSVLSILKLHGGTLTFSDAAPGLRATATIPNAAQSMTQNMTKK